MVVDLTKLNIREVYELPITETLYYTCYIVDKNKLQEQQFKQMQMQHNFKRK